MVQSNPSADLDLSRQIIYMIYYYVSAQADVEHRSANISLSPSSKKEGSDAGV